MKQKTFFRLFTLVLIAMVSLTSVASNWERKNSSIKTRFADDVTPENVLKEYPRPQMVRGNWMNLNGVWDFHYLPRYEEDAPEDGYGDILVPFCVESALSGVKTSYESMVYRRSFGVPADWDGKRILLNFEAVDWRCTVIVNGDTVGTHDGGYDPFSFDITNSVKAGQNAQIQVKVFDPSDRWSVPRGKQVRKPGGIFYTSCSGIWQTVWVEAVNKSYISDFHLTPDIDAQTLTVNTTAGGDTDNVAKVKLTAYHNSTKVAEGEGQPGEDVVLNITDPDLWTPDHPFLYDLKLELIDKNGNVDEVKSYFGMRKISLAQDKDGIYRMMLNNNFVFQTGPLDQGYWPESNLTPPSDEAIQNDIVQMKKYGFNMVRKHIKIEPRRWYYWTDKLGLLVWQDMPSMNYGGTKDEGVTNDANIFTPELKAMIQHHYNSPSIVNWVIFNEAGGQHDTKKYVDLVRSLDKTRLIDEASGWTHYGYGDIYDTHPYPAPSPAETSKQQARANGEYGGIKYAIDGHLWSGNGWGYASVSSKNEFDSTVCKFFSDLAYYKTYKGMSAAVYTQITDVEIEVNGLMTYDRLVKSDQTKLYNANRRLIERDGVEMKMVLPTANLKGQTWKYTLTNPGANYYTVDFDDSTWKTGQSGFGANGQPNMTYGTKWTSSDIWLRKDVILDLTEDEIQKLRMSVYNDEDIEIYVNGVLAYSATGYLTNYKTVDFSTKAREALNPNGVNVFAAHVKQTAGGQFFDLGLLLDETSNELPSNRVVQINMDYTKSSELSFAVGYSLDPNATEPDEVQEFTRLTFADGEANYIGLNDGAMLTPKTVKLDITDLTAKIPEGSTVKYFVYVKPQKSGEGEGTVYSCAVVDYTQDANGVQTPLAIDQVKVSHETGTVLLSASASTDAFNAPRNAYIDQKNTLHWDEPLNTTAVLQSYKVYQNGEPLVTVAKTNKTYNITDATATYAVAAVYSTGTSGLSNNALAPQETVVETNKARHFENNGFSVPEVFTTKRNSATIEYWFKPDELTANSQQVGPGWGQFLITYDQMYRITAGYENTSTKRVQSTSASIKPNEWNHVAITIDGTRINLYINGVIKRTLSVSGYSGMPEIQDFIFGSNGATIKGWIDDVRLWKTARTKDQVYTDMTSEIVNPTAETDLLAYYKMDEINENGVAKLRDCANGNHAPYLNSNETVLEVDTTILNGSDAPNIEASFAFSDTVAVAGSEILAMAQLNGSVVNWKWSEKTTRNEKENLRTVSFVFPKEGTYDVTLTAYDINGNKVDTTQSIKVVNVEMPTADFDIYQPDHSTGSLITLVNKSTGTNATYKWNLPSSSLEQNQEGLNATASYANDGIYNVTLTVTNPAGVVTKTKQIEVSSGARNMAFDVYPNVLLPGETTSLVEACGADSANLVWTIGNDKSRTLILGGSTTFTPNAVGRYDITLTDSETGSSSTLKDALVVCTAKSKTGLYFRNNSESVTVPSPITAKTTKFTVEWWMKPTMALNAGAMATKNGVFSISTEANGAMTATINGKSAFTPEGFVIPNEWHHYAVSLTGSRIYIMRDGVQYATFYPILSTPAWEDLVIGGDQNSMSAVIDEFRIWNTGLKDATLAAVCNDPVEANASGLKVYYKFDELSDVAKDETSNGANGAMEGFQPVLIANYLKSDGVFSLNINTESTIGESTDITADYLTNYKSQFLHTTTGVNPAYPTRYYELEKGTKTSTWQGDIASADEEGVFVDTKNNGGLAYTTTWSGFATDAIDKSVYQTITLPAGAYQFSATTTESDNTSDCYLVVSAGDQLAGVGELSSAIAYQKLDNGSVQFTLPHETQISVGVLYNLPAYSSSVISDFNLTRLASEILVAESGEITGVDEVSATDKLSVTTKLGALVIDGNGEMVRVYTIDGRLVIGTRITGSTTINLPAGIYIVNNTKIMVK